MVPLASKSSTQNGISIGSAVFAGLTSVTDRPTDHDTRSLTTGRIYVHVVPTMRPNNNIDFTHSESLRRLITGTLTDFPVDTAVLIGQLKGLISSSKL